MGAGLGGAAVAVGVGDGVLAGAAGVGVAVTAALAVGVGEAVPVEEVLFTGVVWLIGDPQAANSNATAIKEIIREVIPRIGIPPCR